MSPARTKPLHIPKRRDAQRSRKALLAAARESFDELGIGAPLDQIAQRADVANATLYRHFPDREALIDAVFRDEVEELDHGLDDAARLEDAWNAFEAMLELIFSLQARNRGLAELMVMRFPNIKPLVGEPRRTKIVLAIIDGAQREGLLRSDFSKSDLLPLLWANSRIVDASRDHAPELWRRYLAFLLDGLYANGDTPPPQAPMSERQVIACMSELGRRSVG